MNIQRLVDSLEDEIELLKEDLPNVIHDVSARAIHTSIDDRKRTIEELKIKYPQYIKK